MLVHSCLHPDCSGRTAKQSYKNWKMHDQPKRDQSSATTISSRVFILKGKDWAELKCSHLLLPFVLRATGSFFLLRVQETTTSKAEVTTKDNPQTNNWLPDGEVNFMCSVSALESHRAPFLVLYSFISPCLSFISKHRISDQSCGHKTSRHCLWITHHFSCWNYINLW